MIVAALFHDGILSHDFMRHAVLALTFLAPVCGMVGYLLVVRNEVFAGDALSHVGFTGSLAALALGLDQRVGLLASTLVAATGLAVLGRKARVSDTAIGVFFVWILGLGVLALSEFTRNGGTADSNAGPNVLFGSVFGITGSRALETAVPSAVVIFLMLALLRPLLFVSFEPHVAAARGMKVRSLTTFYFLAAGLVVAEAVQVVGALLLLGLIAAPAAAAHRLTVRPYLGFALAALLALAESWIGLTLSYLLPTLPPSFVLISVATFAYLGAVCCVGITQRRAMRA